MAWTDDRIDVLRKLWDKGLSASQIAGELGEGVTRNAVIGKAHRLGLKSRPSPVKAEAAKPREKAAPKKVVEESSDKIGLLDLTESTCKWPIGHPDIEGFHFCGKESNPGLPYCNDHCLMAYQAQAPRKDRSKTPIIATQK